MNKPLTAVLLLSLSPAAQAATTGNARFGLALYHELAHERGNLFFSPYSVSTALAMTSAGAKGKTLHEMLTALQLEKDPHAALSELQKALASDGDHKPILVTANRLWAQEGAPYYPEFLGLTEKFYGAGVTSLPFQTDPESARKTINDWVSEQTKQKIQDLMPKGSIQKDTDLVLTNAIYFKGAWQNPFDKTATRAEDFHAESGAAPHDFMHRTGSYAYAEDKDFQAMRLLYQGNQLAMTVWLPKAGKKLSHLALTPERVAAFAGQFQREEVIVSLPKFRLEHEERLEKVLPKMGMKLAFTPEADFSGMRPLKPEEQLFISVVAHKAFVEVDEQGTEAAAATGVGMMTASAIMRPRPPKTFKADRPFLFTIEHLATNTILFMGRVEKP